MREIILLVYRFSTDGTYRYTVFDTREEMENFTKNFGDNIVCVKIETVRFPKI